MLVFRQAISFLGVAGKAQLINFNPVRCEPVSLPGAVTFVVANCMVNKWKADGTDFNNRVAECKLGARVSLKLENTVCITQQRFIIFFKTCLIH